MEPAPPGYAESPSAPRVGRREGWVAALLALLIAVCVIGRPLFDTERVLAAVDTATQHLPWSATLAPSDVARPRNPALSDQGLVFYPYYRWVSRSWNAGDPPSWNSYSYAGVPGYGNPQSGAFDPQVALLALFERWGGERAMDWGWALLATLRLAFAGLGAYVLARELGLQRAGAALAGLSFGLSGYLVLWLGYSLGHVPPFLPWILYGLERLRGPRPARACLLVALCLAGAILGGHPETSFYVGATAGLWALSMLRSERRAAWLGLAALALGSLLAAPSLLTFLEYLQLSAAQQVRETNLAHGRPDLIALGLLALGAALCLLWRGAARPAEVHLHGHGEHAHIEAQPERVPLRQALGVGLALAGLLLLLRWRGLTQSAWLALAPDLHGAPSDGVGGYRGIGTYVEEASGWLPLPVLGFALAGLLHGQGVLRRRGLVALLGVCAFLLCLRAPGLLDLYRYLPVVGLGATVRFGTVSALLLGLLAGDALERSSRAARCAAAVAIALAALLPLLWSGAAAPPDPQPGPDDTIGFVRMPEARLDAETSELVGWLHPALPVDLVRVCVEPLDAAGQVVAGRSIEVPAELLAAAPALDGVAPAKLSAIPADARWFRAPYLQANRLEPGLWRFSVDLLRARDGALERLARREVRVCAVTRLPGWSYATIGFSLASLLLLLLLAEPAALGTRGSARLSWCVVALAAAQGVWFARGQNPSVPRAEVFPLTRTEQILARELGAHRYFADPSVLPPSTGLVRGLRAVQGYDGLDVAAFNEFRRLGMKPGVHALLGWHPRGADLDAPAFRLLGVKLLALAEPLDAPGWELVAGPRAAPELAECWIYRCLDPLPRAFCVARAALVSAIGARLAARAETWDPLVEAALEQPWQAAAPFRTARVSEPRFVGNAEVHVDAELDGDGLLVLTEQHFPGWVVRVDGIERPLLQADGIFRGVVLEAGRHAVVFRYEPQSLRRGLLVAAAAAGALLLWLVALRVRSRT
jgi:hypothetical protein